MHRNARTEICPTYALTPSRAEHSLYRPPVVSQHNWPGNRPSSHTGSFCLGHTPAPYSIRPHTSEPECQKRGSAGLVTSQSDFRGGASTALPAICPPFHHCSLARHGVTHHPVSRSIPRHPHGLCCVLRSASGSSCHHRTLVTTTDGNRGQACGQVGFDPSHKAAGSAEAPPQRQRGLGGVRCVCVCGVVACRGRRADGAMTTYL